MKCQGFNHPCNSDEAEHYRMNTKYVNEESNCKDCQKDSDECWQEAWKSTIVLKGYGEEVLPCLN